MRNLTAPKQYENDAGTNFDAGCEGLVLYTPGGDSARLHVDDASFLRINGIPFGVQGMPPANHALTHATGNPDAITPDMIGAMPASTPVALLEGGMLPVDVIPDKPHAATHHTGGDDELKATDIGGVANSDPRLSNARQPIPHSASHAAIGGSDPISPADIGAVARDDERLTNKRDPLPHNSTHFKNGTDPISWEDVGSIDADLVTRRERVPFGYPGLNDLGHIDINLLPQGIPPGPHAPTHEIGGVDYLSPAGIGAADRKHASQHGSGDVDAVKIDASQVTTGVLDLARIPASAVERLVPVPDRAAMLALTSTEVQNGDSVKILDEGGLLFLVVDDTKLGTMDAFTDYSVGRAAAVTWSGVEDKPTEFPPEAHTQAIDTIDGLQGELDSITTALDQRVNVDGTSLMAEDYLPTDPRHVVNKAYADTVGVIPEIQITAEVFVAGPESAGVIPLGTTKPASNVTIPWNITTGNTTKTFRYVFQEDGVISALSRYQFVLYLNSVQTNVDYTFNSLIIAHVGGQVILLSGNLYSNRFGVSNPRVEIPLGNNVLTRDIKRTAGDYIDVEITATKSSGSPDVANILSGPMYDSKLVRNGGNIGSVNVIDFDGTNTTTQSVRNRSYETAIADLIARLDALEESVVISDTIRKLEGTLMPDGTGQLKYEPKEFVYPPTITIGGTFLIGKPTTVTFTGKTSTTGDDVQHFEVTVNGFAMRALTATANVASDTWTLPEDTTSGTEITVFALAVSPTGKKSTIARAVSIATEKPSEIISEGGRRLYTHASGKGVVIEYTDWSGPKKMFVAGAPYRAAKKFGAYGWDSPLANFSQKNANATDYIDGGSTDITDGNSIPVMTDAQLMAMWPGFSTDKTARENCDVWMTRVGINDTASTPINGVPVVEHCRAISDIEGIFGGCDLPNEYQLMIIFLEQNNIDALDPLSVANPEMRLGKENTNGWWNVTGTGYAYSSTESSSGSSWKVRREGRMTTGVKSSIHAVIPIREL